MDIKLQYHGTCTELWVDGERWYQIDYDEWADKGPAALADLAETMSKNNEKRKKNAFEYDAENEILDIHVREDPDCPYPFHEDDWYHQGFYFNEFIEYVNAALKRANVSRRVVETTEEQA